MNYLLYNVGSFISARLLATLLGLKAVSNPDKIKDGKISIRYGNSHGIFENDTTINSSNAIRLCSNSIEFGKWCHFNGFYSPVYDKFETVKEYDFPFLLRKKYHKQGDDIILVNKSEDIPKNTFDRYFVPYIKTDFELGIHLVNGKVIKIFKKVPINNESGFIRNNKRGYHFKIISNTEDNFKVAQDICERLFEKLGLNFGRVDIAYNIETKKYVIWEVNTAPGLNRLTSQLYAEVLRGIINV